MYELTLQQVIVRLGAMLLLAAIHGCLLAFFARLLGDDGPRHDGRLTPSPLGHLDLIGTLAGVLFLIGWSRPMDIDPARLRGGGAGLVLCVVASLAGVAVFGALLQMLHGPALRFLGELAAQNTQMFLQEAGRMCVWFAIFNLAPIPPLAGGLLWRLFASDGAALAARYYLPGAGLLILLLASGAARRIVEPLAAPLTLLLGIR